MYSKFRRLALACLVLTLGPVAQAQSGELSAGQLAALKLKLSRIAELPAVESARTTPIPGIIELKVGNQVVYTDANGDYLIEGQMVEVKSQRNLTEERLDEINKVDFASLPFKDAIVWKNGTGKRRLVVFADPNCGYCKRFEKSLQDVKDITVYTFLIPILGGDSPEKTRAIWCAKDGANTWLAWMLRGEAPPKPATGCDETAIERNLTLSRKIHVNGTPAILLEDGNRIPGAVGPVELEKRLQALAAPLSKS